MKRVLFAGGGTGGHLYPAMALANAMKAEFPSLEVHFVGAMRGVEARVLPAEGLPHTLLPFEPIRRAHPWQNWRLLPSVAKSALGLRTLFRTFRPGLVVGTGGYASGPAGFWGVLNNVPVAVQEQNSYPGFTTRTMSRWARQVHLGFPEAAAHLKPGRHTEVFSLGNPIRPPDIQYDRATRRRDFQLHEMGVVLLVMGGSQGARAINEALLGALESVRAGRVARPGQLQILWATGPNNFDAVQSALLPMALPWVQVHAYISNMPDALAASDIAVSRAGAMATAEQLAWGIPAILVPLPTAAADHQTHNARALADAGAAVFLPESELTPERLWTEINALAASDAMRGLMRRRALERAHPNAAVEIARKLLTLVQNR
jgi:UDP-N-acetylglucosamine--N-acetylmuramyl-(pentapeptide) pyrophosphoryl-undecaprenol N-acetylglucosamine transferase